MSLVDIISSFSGKKVVVIGDVILDKYTKGVVSRISPEAPVQIVEVIEEVYVPGGSGNTACNITSLGGHAYLVGVVGDDSNSSILRKTLSERGVNTEGLVTDKPRPTTLKERVVASKQHIIRIDREVKDPINGGVEEKLRGNISRLVADCDVVVVSDYAKGVVTKSIMSHTIPLAGSEKKYVIVDPRPKNKLLYKNCDFITPNISEAVGMVGDYDHATLGDKLRGELNSNVLLTKGELGMSLFLKDSSRFDFEVVAKDVFDVTGAGDTVVAAFALSLAAGASYREAAEISNYAAGIVVGKFGSATTTQSELVSLVNHCKT